MVLQYKEKKSSHWKDYPGKSKIEGNPRNYNFRLLSHDKSEVLVEKGTYDKVLKRMKQIEFFKHKRGRRKLGVIEGVVGD